MRYFVIEGTFKNPVPVGRDALDKIIEEHLVFLQRGFDEGWILFSGPKQPRGGGVIVAKAGSLLAIEEYLADDPLRTSGVQDYHIVEFEHYKCQEFIQPWFNL